MSTSWTMSASTPAESSTSSPGGTTSCPNVTTTTTSVDSPNAASCSSAASASTSAFNFSASSTISSFVRRSSHASSSAGFSSDQQQCEDGTTGTRSYTHQRRNSHASAVSVEEHVHPDGSTTVRTTTQYDDEPPVTETRRYDASGRELTREQESGEDGTGRGAEQ